MNAWSLLYDVMSNEYEKSKFYYDFDRNKEPETVVDGYSVNGKSFSEIWKEMDEKEPLTPLAESKGPRLPKGKKPSFKDNMPPWGHSDMEALGNVEFKMNLNIDNNNGYWKYSEDVILNELRDYLSGTYRAHYANDNKTQTLDLIDSIGDSEAFCRSNAIKYLSRFGKKDGKSKLDILKAIHYCVLLYHFSGLTQKPKGNYETF